MGVSPYLRKVRTASGATAVQVVDKSGGRRTILAHLGSFHDEAELAASACTRASRPLTWRD